MKSWLFGRLAFVFFAGLIVSTDMILIKRMGTNPLQSELSFISDENLRIKEMENVKGKKSLQEVAAEQKLAAPQAKPMDFLTKYALITGLVLALLVFAYVFFIFWIKRGTQNEQEEDQSDGEDLSPVQTSAKKRKFANPQTWTDVISSTLGSAILIGMFAILLAAAGNLLMFQGRDSMTRLNSEFTHVEGEDTTNENRRAWQVELDQEIMADYTLNHNREQRGWVIIALSALLFFIAWIFAIGYWLDRRRNKPEKVAIVPELEVAEMTSDSDNANNPEPIQDSQS